jgi:hypothetical protein
LPGDLFPPAAKRRQLSNSQSSELGLDTNPQEWGVAEVTKFIGAIPRCNCTDIFKEHVSSLWDC